MATTWTPVSGLTPTTDDPWALLPSISGRFADATALNVTAVLGVTKEPSYAHQIMFGCQTASTAGTIRVWFSPSGTALASGTALTAAEDLSGGSWAANTNGLVTITNGTTLIPAGSSVGIVASSAGTVTNFTVDIQLRKAGFRTTDSGEKFYPYHGTNL